MGMNRLQPNRHITDGNMKESVDKFTQPLFSDKNSEGRDAKAAAKRHEKNKAARDSRRKNR